MISTSVLNFLLEIAVLSFIFPVVFVLVWKMRHHKSLKPTFIGIAVFLVFAQILTSIPYTFFVGMNHPLGNLLRQNPLLLAVYTGIVTAVFEEIGRYLAFRYFLNDQETRQTAISYGLGHGGFECMLSIGWGNLQYYVVATVINQKNSTAGEVPKNVLTTLKELTSFECIINGLIGLLAFALQVALSILVFQAFRNVKLRRRLMCIAIALHAIYYIPSGLYAAHMIPKVVQFILNILIVGFTIALAAHIYHKMGENEEEQQKSTAKKGTSAPEEKNWAFANKKLTNIEDKKKQD